MASPPTQPTGPRSEQLTDDFVEPPPHAAASNRIDRKSLSGAHSLAGRLRVGSLPSLQGNTVLRPGDGPCISEALSPLSGGLGKDRLAMHREMMHANVHIGESRTSIRLDPVVWCGSREALRGSTPRYRSGSSRGG